jgi:hypothetical protein
VNELLTITFENQWRKQWLCDYVFNDYETAKEFLLKRGFIEKNRIFERADFGWIELMRAYITPRKVYGQ